MDREDGQRGGVGKDGRVIKGEEVERRQGRRWRRQSEWGKGWSGSGGLLEGVSRLSGVKQRRVSGK